MKYLAIFMLGAALLAGCSGSVEKDSWQLAAYSAQCQSNPQFKTFMLNLNLCKQESYNRAGFTSCIDRATSDWKQLPSACQAETQSLIPKSTAFFLDKVLSDDAAAAGQTNEQKLNKATFYIGYWLSNLPKSADFFVVEALYNKIYAKTLSMLNKDVLDASTLLLKDDHQVSVMLKMLTAALALPKNQGFQELFVISSFHDLLRAMEPKLKLVLKLRQIHCQMQACRPETIEELNFLQTILNIQQGKRGDSAVSLGTGSYTQAMKAISDSQTDIVAALESYQTPYAAGTGTAGFESNRNYPSSRLFDLMNLLMSFNSLHNETLKFLKGEQGGQESISYGVSRASMGYISSYLTDKGRSLRDLADTYKAHIDSQVQIIKQALAAESDLNTVKREQSLQLRELERLGSEINALRNAYLLGEEEYAGFQSKFNRLNVSPSALGTLWSSEVLEEGLSVTAEDAQYKTGSPELDYHKLAIRSIPLEAGQALHIQVQGEWAPTCALSKARPDLSFTNLLVGPNGYVETQAQGKSTMTAREKSTRSSSYYDSSSTSQRCINFRTPDVALIAGSTGSMNLNGCNQNGRGKRTDISSATIFNESESKSNQLNIQGGLTLPHTPFRDLPAGSIVAVTTGPSGEFFRILNRATRIEVSENSSVHLIVNDCNEQAASTSSALNLDIFKLTSSNKEVRDAMLGAHQRIDRMYQTAFELLTLGSDIDAEINLLAQKARADIFAEFAAFSKFELARQYLETMLTHKSNQLLRRSKILARNQAYQNELLRYASSLREGKLGLVRKDILTLEANDILADLSLAQVGPQLYEISDHIIKNVFPVLFFHAERPDLQKLAGTALQAFQSKVGIESNLGEMTKAYATFLDDLNTAMGQVSAQLRYKNQLDDLLIAIPNPHLDKGKTLSRGTPTLDDRSALAAWQAFFGTNNAPLTESIFKLSPETVYGYHFAEGGISCNSRKPVIEDIAFAFVLDNRDIDRNDLKLKSRNKDLPIRIGPDFSFITPKGPLSFQVAHPSEGVSNARFGLVRKDAFEDSYELLRPDNELGSAGKGLSPFSSWGFNTAPVKAFVKYNSSLFYKNPALGALLLADKEKEQVAQDYFEDDFSDFAIEPTGNMGHTPVTPSEVELFPQRITDILVLIRFSSLTGTLQDELGWIKGCK
jgi:hypothetical protein